MFYLCLQKNCDNSSHDFEIGLAMNSNILFQILTGEALYMYYFTPENKKLRLNNNFSTLLVVVVIRLENLTKNSYTVTFVRGYMGNACPTVFCKNKILLDYTTISINVTIVLT